MKLVQATPLRRVRSQAFVTRASGCSLEEVQTPVYALHPAARRFNDLRREKGIGLRDAAVRLGVRAVDLSDLERGRLVLEIPQDWTALLATVEQWEGP